MNLLTIGDYYRARYNRTVELIMTICIMISYLGWVSAQVVALGLVFNIVSGGVVTQSVGMVIGISIVLAYTMFGGMWSVAYTDIVQLGLVALGLSVALPYVLDGAGAPVAVGPFLLAVGGDGVGVFDTRPSLTLQATLPLVRDVAGLAVDPGGAGGARSSR